MYSFYGGKQGASFIISKSFSSVQEMINAFKQGYNYTEVAFDEYVLINTEDKTSEENGRLYRRSYEFNKTDENNNPTGGAIYIGTIVGPAGAASKLGLNTYDNISKKIDDLGVVEDAHSLTSKGVFEIGKDLIPGTYKENGTQCYNDDIKWASICIREPGFTEAKTWVGFKIPYTVFDFETEHIKPEDDPKVEQVPVEDGQFHPFYQKWKFSIPRGFRGDSFEKFRVITASAEDGVEKYEGQVEDREKNNQICVCDFVIDDGTTDGIKKTIYVGDYNVIKNITMSDTGFITVEGTHSFEQKINENNPIKFLNNIKIEEGTQQVQVAYNISNDYYSIGQPLNAIQEMVINPNNYHLLVYYNSSIIRNQLNNSVKASYNGKDDWLDLGSIKDESGILIGFNIPRITSGEGKNDTIDDAIVYLNKIYPNGLGESDTNLKGKVVTIGNGTEIKDFYAYDYVNYKPGTEELGTWYYIGTFDNNIEKILLSDTEEVALRDLSEGGVWLKITELGA